MVHSNITTLRGNDFASLRHPQSTLDHPRVPADANELGQILSQSNENILGHIAALLHRNQAQGFGRDYVSRLFANLPFFHAHNEALPRAQQDLALVQSLLIALEERNLSSGLRSQVQELRHTFDTLDGFMEMDATFRQSTFFFARNGLERWGAIFNLASALSGMAASALAVWAGARQNFALGLISGLVNASSQSGLQLLYRLTINHENFSGEMAADLGQAGYDALVCSLVSYGMGSLGTKLGITETSSRAVRASWAVAEFGSDVGAEYFSGQFAALRRIAGYETTDLSHLTLRRMAYGLTANALGELLGDATSKPLHHFSPQMHHWALQNSIAVPVSPEESGAHSLQTYLSTPASNEIFPGQGDEPANDNVHPSEEEPHVMPIAVGAEEYGDVRGTLLQLVSSAHSLELSPRAMDASDPRAHNVRLLVEGLVRAGIPHWRITNAFLQATAVLKSTEEQIFALELFLSSLRDATIKQSAAFHIAEALLPRLQVGSPEVFALAKILNSVVVLYSNDGLGPGFLIRLYLACLSKFGANLEAILEELGRIAAMATAPHYEDEDSEGFYRAPSEQEDRRRGVEEARAKAARGRLEEMLMDQLIGGRNAEFVSSMKALYAYWKNTAYNEKCRGVACNLFKKHFSKLLHLLSVSRWEECKETLKAVLLEPRFDPDFRTSIQKFIANIVDHRRTSELELLIRELIPQADKGGMLRRIFLEDHSENNPYLHLLQHIHWSETDAKPVVEFWLTLLELDKRERYYGRAYLMGFLSGLWAIVFSAAFKDSPFREGRLLLLDALTGPEELLTFLEEFKGPVLSEEEYFHLLPRLEEIYLQRPELRDRLTRSRLYRCLKVFFPWIEHLLAAAAPEVPQFLSIFKIELRGCSHIDVAGYAAAHPDSAFQIFYAYYQAGLPLDHPETVRAYLEAEDRDF
ncbi:MAG: hypothetical protein HQM15_09170 [Deltaproteobacteria bacterium]|nr:hypothetical protein [Deltaproteobacteria bacterium]